MAGHSKWNNIKNKKGATDAKRAKIFGQLSKLIRIAVKEGGSDDPKFNPSLRLMLDKARAANMPKTNIDRAIERGTGKTAAGTTLQEVLYEGFGPGGIAILASAVTDNPNRTAAEVKFAFSRNGGSLAGPGSAMYLFSRNKEGGYDCTMPMEIEDAQLLAQFETLLEKLEACEDIEEIYTSLSQEHDSDMGNV